MTKRIFWSVLLAAAAVLLASLMIVMGVLYDYFGGVEQTHLKSELSLAAAAVERDGADYLRLLDSDDYRLTWVAGDGTVLFDTQISAADMENHSQREEIAEALTRGEGESSRYSATLTEKTLYYARALSDGTVLRISVRQLTAVTLMLGVLQPVLVVTVIAVILSAVLANALAQRIVNPLNELDLDHPLDNQAYPELAPLLRRLHLQHREISNQYRDLKQKTDEFEQTITSMNEGLVMLDDRGTVLSINPAAAALFHTDHSCVGQPFVTVDRSPNVSEALRQALTDGRSEIRLSREGREYQLDISRIQSGGAVVGAVLLTFDMTEQAGAEQARREFTANVSHELKTPLQSIIGSAELLENGLVKPEDTMRFVGHIHQEAARLVTLIEDIIRLSQLDEGGELPMEPVDLPALAREVAATLADTAAAKGVILAVEGESGTVIGVRRLLYEILYNLCDNAVKYNVEGGRVDVRVSTLERGVAVTVADTGIGIPPEHRSRVFERFYRVDKSHSKASGGTGLGLSIVKHAAQYHRAEIELESTVGKGTAITVTFPAD